ncbi:ATP-binding protein, partial [Stenotrophomonas maltophilia]|nr:ATP-binding protein [Stenotrophomonas maltophilia]
LLVDDKHYNDVAEWVNRTHLGMRFTYYRVRRNDDAFAREPSAKSLLHKLELREHVFESWLRRELGKRFDYECVDAKQLRNVDRGITREGQVKHPGDRFEKDDRSAVGDRRRWILGFNNHDKVGAFEREAQELAKRIASCETDIARLRGQRDRDNERRLACHELVSISWNEIDIAAPQQRLSDIEATLRDLREGNADLAKLAKQIDAVRADIEQSRRTYEDVRVERGQLVKERDRL